MPKKLRCDACFYEFIPENPTNPVCSKCGNDQYFTPVGPPLRIKLNDGSNSITFHKSCIVGKDSLKIFGENGKYVSREQFELKKGDEHWTIKGREGCVNSTYVSNKNIDGFEHQIKENDELLIGNNETDNGLKLKINFDS